MTDYTTSTSRSGVETDETSELIASNIVEGTKVYNRNEHIGQVYNFMVNKRTGQVEYAVMSFGGFLGIGESYYPLPWKALTYDTSLGGYMIDIDKRKLEEAPSYREGETFDRVYGKRINDHYGVPYGGV
jgi:PRC-barrel domain